MKIDAGLGAVYGNVKSDAKTLEDLGYDGIMSIELAHDPFLPLMLAAEHTERIELKTSIAVAFARNPMILANLAHDLNAFSKGRFTLGLGSQIRPHITNRFSMPWSSPAARMKEMLEAIRAIWANWYDGEPLHYKGKFYNHTLMTPMFTPRDIQYGKPKIILAAVGPKMTEAAAQVADGMIVHSFSTEKYLRELTLPNVEKGLAESGRTRDEFEFSFPVFTVSGATEEEFEETKRATCKQIAFYGSTPAYKGVLDVHGWGELQPELNRLSKIDRWDEMGTLITDDILETFAVVGEPEDMVDGVKARYGDLIDRVSIKFPDVGSERLAALIERMKAA